ncbi:MAG: DNA topoisomerase IV subunit A [Polyangiaceae bacterium]
MARTKIEGSARKVASVPPPPPLEDAPLAEEAQRRYLNYALSVITSRALPDVRDGLKPVQRRILYAMKNDMRLDFDAKPKKSAAVVGDVMGKYHPHGDTAIYDAMVRLAQDWVQRVPLVEGQGNFGSIDGDAPAAMRYTEARLARVSNELLDELPKNTVDYRPSYDGSNREPVVLPARFPHLLVNGAQGIAVGMATSIPPHNLGEVIDATIALIDAPDLTTKKLLSFVKGPDFPTGGQLHAAKQEIESVYETGRGTLKLRGDWTEEEIGKSPAIVVTSIPFGVERSSIVEKIAAVILSKKLPGLVDVRDESTDVVRIVLELKRGTDPQLVMAYLYKQTPLSVTVSINITCLVPLETADSSPRDEDAAGVGPKLLPLRDVLAHFIAFRLDTITKRTRFELAEINARIHVLEGLETVFDALDEVIRIIRQSEGRADAKQKLMKRFSLSDEQVEAILELRLYRLAKLEILIIKKELAEKRAAARKLDALLKSDAKRYQLIKDELLEIRTKFGDKRRTKIVGATNEPEFQAEDFIVDEDATVVLSAQGWVKRAREIKDLATTRMREGDAVLSATAGSTRASVAFFSSQGSAYVSRIHDVPASTGYGDPVQKLFKLADGERMVAMSGFDPRVLEVPAAEEGAEPSPPFAVAITKQGLGFRFALAAHRDPSTRSGRKFARLNEGDEVVAVFVTTSDDDVVMVATSDGHALAVAVPELALLSGAGKGSMVIKMEDDAVVVGALLGPGASTVLTAVTDKGKEHRITADRVLGSRADRGHAIVKRDAFVRTLPAPAEVPSLAVEE